MQNIPYQFNEPVDFEICPKFEKIFSILSIKWNGLILEVLMNAGPQRFKDITQCITKCSDRVLVERLKLLEDEGLVERCTYPDSARIEYRLTDQGETLRPVLEEVHRFADRWY